jgi:hypothetical protein
MNRAIPPLILAEAGATLPVTFFRTLPINSDLLLNFAEGPTIHQR